MKNPPRVAAIAASILFVTSCSQLLSKTETNTGSSNDDAERKKARNSQLRDLPAWQNQDGIAPRFAFWNIVNRCQKYQVDYKATVEQSSGPFAVDQQSLSVLPKDYTFYSNVVFRPLREKFGIGPVTIWVRKKYASGMKEQAPWIKTMTLDAGSTNRLEVQSDCKSVAARTDEEPVHGCYSWIYSPACGVANDRSMGPQPSPEQCTGNYGVEGDMSESCEFETPDGTCKVRYKELAANCLRR